MKRNRSQITEFYKVGYTLDGEHKWACYFDFNCAQEAMMKMIQRGVNVTGMETQMMVWQFKNWHMIYFFPII